MKEKRIFTGHNMLLAGVALAVVLVLVFIFTEFFGFRHGYLEVAVAVICVMTILFIDRGIILQRYMDEQKVLMADIELKDVLYQLLQNTSSYAVNGDIYEEILIAAINAIHNGNQGSIIDLRNEDKVKYVAVQGFEREILEKMGLGLKDTYLYKETDGSMDKTVIIRNSVNYNKLHSNDEIISDLIEAGTADIQSTLCTPIRIQNQTIGLINIDSVLRDAFSDRDVQIIELFALEVGKMIQYHEILQENLYLSRYDSMTKVYNRGYFYEKHRELFMKEPKVPYIFVATDIDNLKEVNDAYGHAMGDQLLIKFVDAVKRYLPEEAIIGRYGGDEFNILFPNSTTHQVEQMMKLANSHLKANPLSCEGKEICVLYSYGVVAYPDEELDYKQLIGSADQRMYDQKKRLKGRLN